MAAFMGPDGTEQERRPTETGYRRRLSYLHRYEVDMAYVTQQGNAE